ncbi:MAG: hypothetical protein ACE5FK_02005 [Candidatus Methylomirabilia bacterium]
MTKRKTILVTLSVAGSIVAVALLYGLLFGVQTFAVVSWKKPRSENPELYILPQRLHLPSEPQFAGTRLSYFGYDLEAPWTDIETEDAGKSFARISFKSGQGIVVFNPAESIDLIAEFMAQNPDDADRTLSVFGPDAMKSNYSLYQAILNATPDELSIFMPKRDAIKLPILLILKRALLANAESGMYAFEFRDLRGFQFGNPARTNRVIIHLFVDHRQVELLVFVAKDSDATLSQDEITHVIRTLRPAA